MFTRVTASILGLCAIAIGFAQVPRTRPFTPPSPVAVPGVVSAQLPPGQVDLVRQLMDRSIKGSSFGRRTLISGKPVLILYDSNGPYGYIGNGYARMLAALLTHFKTYSQILPVERYTQGMISANAATFYIGNTYDNALPASFVSDASNPAAPLCWVGYNIWKLAWNPDYSQNPAFAKRFGFQFNGLDTTKYASVDYNTFSLKTDPYSFGESNVSITNATKAKVVSRYWDSTLTQSLPYIVHSNNLWFVAENPLQDSSTNLTADRSAAFQDCLHDILRSGIGKSHKAVLRIEDVHANIDPDSLRAIADYLYSQKVPYVVSVIPHYRDPLGYYTGGDPVDIDINSNPDFVSALQYMTSKGGQIIMHGDTHQYDDVPNTVSGVSGDDYEFYRFGSSSKDPTNDGPLGPAYEDSAEWVNGRLDEGMAILARAGFTPTGWNTPHYFASQLDYIEFAKRYKFSMCRGKIFTADDAGNAYMLDQMVSWPIVDELGMVRLPENLGFVSTRRYGITGQRPLALIQVAKQMKVIRDGWVGCYFHPFLDLGLLKRLVAGIKNSGYTFVMPSEASINQ